MKIVCLGVISVLLLAPMVAGLYENCDYFQTMTAGVTYYIYNPNYPGLYYGYNSCRWRLQAPAGLRVQLLCNEVNIPASTSCTQDRIAVSLSGDVNLADSKNYCGAGTFSHNSTDVNLNFVFSAPSTTKGGKFLCTATTVKVNPPCDCGWKLASRIVGGVETGINEYPMMAGLVDLTNQNVFCGGSIINTRYVLTAAHCLTGRDVSKTMVLVGDHDIYDGTETSTARLVYVQSFKTHESFGANNQNDIAIITTATDIPYSLQVGPVCLPFRYQTSDFNGIAVTALGWGTTEYGGSIANKLQKVSLNVLQQTTCVNAYPNKIASSQFCTYAANKDSCQNDSGGPLAWLDPTSARLNLVGVISYGPVGCATTKPAINTRVTSYLQWIINNTPGASYCAK